MSYPSIKFVSWSEAGVSYTLASISYIKALLAKGVNLTWDTAPFRPDFMDEIEGKLSSLLYKQINYDIVLFHLFPEFALPFFESERKKKKFIVVFTTWETTIIPDKWVKILNQIDLVLVPCNWNKETFRESGVQTPIEVVPHIFDLDDSAQKEPLQKFKKKLPYSFYTLGEINRRKGQLEALECYLESFTAYDPVVFKIKAGRHFFQSYKRTEGIIRKIWEKYKNPPKVELIDYYISNNDLKQLHQSSHCFFSMTKGEGWGLAAFEAGGLGNPVLIPRMGGQADFLPTDYSYAIDYTLVPIPFQKKENFYRGFWAEPSKKSAGKLMQKLAQDYFQAPSWEETETYKQGQKLQQYIQQNFSSDIVADHLLEALRKHYKEK